MNSIQDFLCGFIDQYRTKPSTLSRPVVLKKRNVISIDKPLDQVSKKCDSVYDFLWVALKCEEPVPPEGLCVTTADCNAGEICKESQCVLDPTHCLQTGCDEHYECDVETGDCYFVPECFTNEECNQPEGEMCINNVCKFPLFCIDDSGCAPGWECVQRNCVKS